MWLFNFSDTDISFALATFLIVIGFQITFVSQRIGLRAYKLTGINKTLEGASGARYPFSVVWAGAGRFPLLRLMTRNQIQKHHLFLLLSTYWLTLKLKKYSEILFLDVIQMVDIKGIFLRLQKGAGNF